MMRIFLLSFLLIYTALTSADTIDHYMNIATNIPTMEMKADPQSQAWARSARDVLIITNESIAETLLTANQLAKNQDRPLFCLPNQIQLNAATVKSLIEDAYQHIPNVQTEKSTMTVSQVAWLAITQHYPCNNPAAAAPTNTMSLPHLMAHEQG